MVILQKSGDSAVKFVFTDSDHYLYGNGEIEVPVNGLMLVIDESNMVTFKKLSGDPFLSFDPANSNLSDKAGVINFYKTEMVGSTGGGSESGITSGDVQTMIDNSLEDYYDKDEVDAGFDEVDAALSGKADASDVTEEISAAVSGKADTTAVTAVENDVLVLQDALAGKANTAALTAHTSDTGIHVNQQEKDGWNAKLDASAYTPVDLSEYWTSAQTEASIEAATSGKSDATAVTAVNNALTAHTSDTGIHVTQADKTSWNAKQDALSAGTGIEISGNVISATGGGSVTVDPTLDTGSTNPVANSAITAAIDAKIQEIDLMNQSWVGTGVTGLRTSKNGSNYLVKAFAGTINNKSLLVNDYANVNMFSLVETSAITSSITSASTNAEVAGAKAVYDAIQAGGGGGGSVTVDSSLDINSSNPVENQAIAQAVDDLQAEIDIKADQSELYELLGGSNDEMNPVTPIRLLRISQSDYDTLVENYETEPDVLYIITPDEENEGGNDWEE